VTAGVVAATGVLAQSEPVLDWDWTRDHLDEIWDLTVEHLSLTLWAVGLGFAISMALALASIRWRWVYEPLASFCGVLYSIPSVALFGLLVPITGLGFVTAQIALVSYTLLILLRNIVAGFDGVSPAVREAADGMGYERWRRVLRIDLPLALPAIVAGLRIATVTTIGLVTVTGLVDAGGYGSYIKSGLTSSIQFPTQVTLGTGLSILMAIVLDLGFVGVERRATRWRRRGAQDARTRRRTGVAEIEGLAVEGGAAGG
jgi:osmoprotectant transport system permease protein